MSQCPFCATAIDEQITLYGGTCQTCFAFVPGEEAATDPGEVVKAVLQQQDQKRAKRRAFLPLLVAVPLVIGVVSVSAWFVFAPAPELAVLDLDAGQYYMPELDHLVVASLDQKDETNEQETGTITKGASTNRSEQGDAGRDAGAKVAALNSGSDGTQKVGIKFAKLKGSNDVGDVAEITGDKADELAGTRRSVGTADLGGDIDVQLTGSVLSTTGGPGSGLEMQLGALNQPKPPLSDPQLIARMVQSKMRRELPKLRTCYESSLRGRPELEGSWVLTFTVTPDGKTKGVQAVAGGMTDEGFEACMVRRMDAWRFDPITRSQPVKKTVDFTR